MRFAENIGIILLLIGGFITGLVFILALIAAINHRYHLNKETDQFFPPGKMIEVNGHHVHVYGVGKGDITLVFMAGHGTSSPTLDFKPLWSKMADHFRIVVVERAGYGWSETGNTPRNLDTLLEETREALQIAQEKGLYVLVPHSMSGLEALYWAQKYPGEVKAIIGLDPAIPDFIEAPLEVPKKTSLYLMYFISRIGLSRFMPYSQAEDMFPPLKSGDLNEQEKEMFMAMFYKSAYSKNMLEEIDYLEENAKIIQAGEIPLETPMYFFIAKENEVPGADWPKKLSNYIQQVNTGKYMYLDCGHYLHHYKSDLIAKETRAFLKELSHD